MPDPINALALAERLRDDAKEARLAAFARLMLRTAQDLEAFVHDQEAISDSRPPQPRAD
jgi:hypothetical protein